MIKRIHLTIDGIPVTVDPGTTVLEAARKVKIDIPTLCYHPALKTEGSCRICVVEVEGKRNLMPSCCTPVEEGMVVKTSTPLIRRTRKMVLELLIANHPQDCLTCSRHGKCELQDLAVKLGVREQRFEAAERVLTVDKTNPAIVRDPAKCILCGRCVRVCRDVQNVGAIDRSFRGTDTVIGPAFASGLGNVSCVSCGQCIAVCPVGALRIKNDIDRIWDAIYDPKKQVIVQVAPAVRAALGEEFGMRPGALVTGKIIKALRKLGVDKVFDTQFAADVTIMEEGTEFLERLEKGGQLPLITSCCPGWVNFCETFFPDLIGNMSSCKSPQQIFGALAKTYYADLENDDPSNYFVLSVMPCTAKKTEEKREEMNSSGYQDVDAVITTRELAEMIRSSGIDFANLEEDMFDLAMGLSSGAGTIFGVTGGVMEAAVRTVYEIVEGKPLANIDFYSVRGFGNVKYADITLKDRKLRLAVVSGLGAAKALLQRVQAGEEKVDFIEVMACSGGCIMGGGQPISLDPEIRERRASALYRNDAMKKVRKSHENLAVKYLYDNYLGKPNGPKAHELLHTHYTAKDRI